MLVLAPHPDDEVFGCGGSILCHLGAGDLVTVIVVTDGAFGPCDDRRGYALTRQRESRRAAEVLGYGEPIFWDLPDRGLEYGEPLIERILATLDTLAADIVYAPSWWEIHPDHLVLALATAEAVRRCARPVQLVMYEIGVPLHPNILLDITSLRARKRRAMACFQSQLEHQAYDRQVAALNRFRTYTLGPEVKAAEGFRRVSPEELREDPWRIIRPGVYYSQTGAGFSAGVPLVSVVLAGVDGDRRLAEVLEALALQTYPHIEILLVGTLAPELVASAAWNGRFPLRGIQSDAGLNWAGTANLGLAQARGDYLLVIDGHHVLPLPDHVTTLMDTVVRDGGSRGACSAVRGAATGGDQVPAIDLWELLNGATPPLQSVLFARILYLEGCRFDESLSAGVGWDFLMQLAQITRIAPSGRATLAVGDNGEQAPGIAGPGTLPSRLEEGAAKWMERLDNRQWRGLLLQARSRLGESEAVRVVLQEQLTDRERELERYRAQCAALTQDASAREATEREQAQLIQILRTRLQAQESQLLALDSLRQEVDALRHSTSWRLTAPLRLVVLWLARHLRKPPEIA